MSNKLLSTLKCLKTMGMSFKTFQEVTVLWRSFFPPLPYNPLSHAKYFLPLISAITGFHDLGLETRWTQLLITSNYYLPQQHMKDQSTMRAENNTGCGVISATKHDFCLFLTITFYSLNIEKFYRCPFKAAFNIFDLRYKISIRNEWIPNDNPECSPY